MIEIKPVFSNASAALWIDDRGMPNGVLTPGADGYSTTAFQDGLSVFLLRKAPDSSRILFADCRLGVVIELQDISGSQLAALGDLSGQTDEQIISLCIA